MGGFFVRARGNKKFKNAIMRAFFLCALAAAAAAYIYVDRTHSQANAKDTFVFTETEVKFPYSFLDMASAYTNGNKYFYLSTRDGVKYVSSAGAVKWDLTYSMADPVMKGRGEYAAVCDNKGFAFYMLGPAGPVYERKFDHPILFFTVNARGDAGVLLSEDGEYRLIVLNVLGETILEYVHADADNIPLCIDVAEDGRIAAVSFLDIGNIRPSSRIVFMYTSEEGKNYSRTFIGGVECPDLFVAYIYFVAGNRLLYLSESEIAVVNVESAGGASVARRMALSNKIDAFTLTGGKGFAVSYGEALSGRRNAAPAGALEIYNLDLNLTGAYNGEKFTYLNGTADYLIAADGRNCKAFNIKGALLWEYASPAEARKFMLLEANANNILLMTNTGASVIRRSKAAS